MKHLILFALLLGVPSAFATQAQPVPVPEDQSLTPQIDISGVGAATLNASRSAETGNQAKSAVNFSDSALLVGAAQRLADGEAIGSTGLGWLTLDETNKGLGTQLFLNQAFLDYQGERLEALIGRSDNPTAHVVDFPTIRGDDLVTLTNPLNPFSNGENAEEHRYSNVASVTLNQGLKYYESVHAQHLINSAGIGTETGINSFGASFEFLGEPGMEAFQRVPSYGFGFEHFTVNSGGASGLNQVYAGGVINLNTSVTNRWDLRVQDIAGFGSDLRSFRNVTDSYQADSNTLTASVRYLSSPFGSPGYQVALTGAYKDYFKVDNSKSYGGALTGVKRLGQGFDLVAQYLGQWRGSALAMAQSSDVRYEQTVEVGFVFSFDATINQHLAPRRTILNQQHQYVPN
ncbi:MAG: hypothetical protein JST04_13540 [Bdellovibrionales bacterium]|nr:hypothetical protein [Bdellovibrionales bacterium]